MTHSAFKFVTSKPRPSSPRTRLIAKWFGLRWSNDDATAGAASRDALAALLPAPGEIVFITGASGAGKSSLLRVLRETFADDEWIDLNMLGLPADRAVVDCFGDRPLRSTLPLLARVGLSEAWTFLRTPEQLSDGQRWRLRLALAIESARTRNFVAPLLVCDEFAAVLDRVTAAVVAHALRRLCGLEPGRSALRAIVVTSHDDLTESLMPDVRIECDFESVRVERRREESASPNTNAIANAAASATGRSTRVRRTPTRG